MKKVLIALSLALNFLTVAYCVNALETGRCDFEEAKAELEKLVLNKIVRVEGEYTDQYGRLLALVYTDNYLVNLEMVKARLGKI